MKYFLPFIALLFPYLPAAFADTDADSAFAEQISDEALAEQRGMGGIDPNIVNYSALNANSSGNTFNNAVTGFNSIGNQAFQNASGIINILQNSGNGVIIQNSTIVNLTLK